MMAIAEKRWTARAIGRSCLKACRVNASNPPTHSTADTMCVMPAVMASSWSPSDELCPARAGSAAAATATASHAPLAPVVAEVTAPTATTRARIDMTRSARVLSISFAYVDTTAGVSASMSGTPSTSASTKNNWTAASSAQTPAAHTARTASCRPALDNVPSFPDGARIVADRRSPTVAIAARSVRTRSAGAPQVTSGPGSAIPGSAS